MLKWPSTLLGTPFFPNFLQWDWIKTFLCLNSAYPRQAAWIRILQKAVLFIHYWEAILQMERSPEKYSLMLKKMFLSRPAVSLCHKCMSSHSKWPHAMAYLVEQSTVLQPAFPLLHPQLLFPDPVPTSLKSWLTSKTKRHIFLYESLKWGVGFYSDGRETSNRWY